MRMRMHADQLDIDPVAVQALVAAQFPQWRQLTVQPLSSGGTVNALFRLGSELVLRFPLRPAARAELIEEQDAARRLAPHLRLRLPQPIAVGRPGPGYPGPWSIYRWIAGRIATAADQSIAPDLADFVGQLHSIDTEGRPPSGVGRGGPLAGHDDAVRAALAVSGGLFDTDGVRAQWNLAIRVEGPARAVWLHADLMPGNLLVEHGRLSAVIDLGTVTIGDPALDLMPAWNLFAGPSRATFRRLLQVDDAAWQRGRGWAIMQSAIALPYYLDTNPIMAETARRTLAAVLEP